MKSVDITITHAELAFLIDLMWGSDPIKTKVLAQQFGVDDNQLERQLVICLGAAKAAE